MNNLAFRIVPRVTEDQEKHAACRSGKLFEKRAFFCKRWLVHAMDSDVSVDVSSTCVCLRHSQSASIWFAEKGQMPRCAQTCAEHSRYCKPRGVSAARYPALTKGLQRSATPRLTVLSSSTPCPVPRPNARILPTEAASSTSRKKKPNSIARGCILLIIRYRRSFLVYNTASFNLVRR